MENIKTDTEQPQYPDLNELEVERLDGLLAEPERVEFIADFEKYCIEVITDENSNMEQSLGAFDHFVDVVHMALLTSNDQIITDNLALRNYAYQFAKEHIKKSLHSHSASRNMVNPKPFVDTEELTVFVKEVETTA